MFKLIQQIVFTMIFGALGAAIIVFLTQKQIPIIGTIDSAAIIEPIKREVVNSILNQADEITSKENLKKITKKLNEIITDFGNKGITLIEKKAIVTEGLIHDYTKEIQRRLAK